jgi:thioredoxin reductase (NADPH)
MHRDHHRWYSHRLNREMGVAGAPAWQASKHQPSPLETSFPGIFAAGDVRSGSVKRCAAAVGEGGMAVAGIQMRLAGSS